MKKKIVAVVMCLAMSTAMLAGCGGGKSQDGAKEGKDSDSGEITEIVWQYPSAGNLGAGFQDVEDALNEMLERDIGVHVTFETTDLMNSQKEASLMISAGEQLDICLTAFTGLGPMVDSELIIPIDDLVETYGKDIREHCGVLLDGCSYGDNLYGVCTAFTAGKGYGYLIRTDLLEKYGITIDANKYYTLEELGEIFAQIKDGEGDSFYCTIPWNTTTDPLNNSYMEYDKVTGSLSGGVLMLNRGFEDLTLYNLFETEEYKAYCEMMYDWAQKGYISADAAVTTELPETILSSGNYLGMFYWADPGSAGGVEKNTSMDLTTINLVEPYVANSGGQGIMWNIAVTSEYPEKAMETLNYIYQNKEAAWLLQFGLEGESYEIVEESEEGTQIKYLSEDTSTLPYFQVYGIYGDRFEWPVVSPDPIDLNKQFKEWDESIPESRYSPSLGYNFVQTDVTSEIAAVETVIEQYTPSLNSGALDPEKALPEFISSLRAAGIDKIIEENQKQLDKWMEKQ